MLKILNCGHPVLRTRARAINPEDISSQKIAALIDQMYETLVEAPGVGLAAPQIGEDLQLIMVEDKAEYLTGIAPQELKEMKRTPVAFHVLINPVIELLATPDQLFYEGCLSLPGFAAMVPRAAKIRVRALDQQASPLEIIADGWYARILQHEIDHLAGTLFLDRMWSRSFTTSENYVKHVKGRPLSETRREMRSIS